MVAGGVAWALLAGIYLVLAGQANTTEIVAGLLAGISGALLSVAARKTGVRRFRFREAPWSLLLGRPVLVLLTDTARVGLTLARAVLHGPETEGAPEGATVRQTFARGGDAQDAARRGLVTLGVSLTPNSYVLRIMDDRDEMRVHRLAERKPSANRAWPL